MKALVDEYKRQYNRTELCLIWGNTTKLPEYKHTTGTRIYWFWVSPSTNSNSLCIGKPLNLDRPGTFHFLLEKNICNFNFWVGSSMLWTVEMPPNVQFEDHMPHGANGLENVKIWKSDLFSFLLKFSTHPNSSFVLQRFPFNLISSWTRTDN